MTNSLREEIDIELKKHLDKWKYVPSMMEVADITIKVIEKRINKKANDFLNIFDVDIDKLDLLEGRLIDELPSEVAYLKALIDIKRMVLK